MNPFSTAPEYGSDITRFLINQHKDTMVTNHALALITRQAKELAMDLERQGKFLLDHDNRIIRLPKWNMEFLKAALLLCPEGVRYEVRGGMRTYGHAMYNGVEHVYGNITFRTTFEPYFPMEYISIPFELAD